MNRFFHLLLCFLLTSCLTLSKPAPDYRVAWVEYLGGDRTTAFRIRPSEVPTFQEWHRRGLCGEVYLTKGAETAYWRN